MLYKIRFNEQLDRIGVIDRHDPEVKPFLAQRMGAVEASGTSPLIAAAIASLSFLVDVSINVPEEGKPAVTQGLDRGRNFVESENPVAWSVLYAHYLAHREYLLEIG